jgi:hypothetical protein
LSTCAGVFSYCADARAPTRLIAFTARFIRALANRENFAVLVSAVPPVSIMAFTGPVHPSARRLAGLFPRKANLRLPHEPLRAKETQAGPTPHRRRAREGGGRCRHGRRIGRRWALSLERVEHRLARCEKIERRKNLIQWSGGGDGYHVRH